MLVEGSHSCKCSKKHCEDCGCTRKQIPCCGACGCKADSNCANPLNVALRKEMLRQVEAQGILPEELPSGISYCVLDTPASGQFLGVGAKAEQVQPKKVKQDAMVGITVGLVTPVPGQDGGRDFTPDDFLQHYGLESVDRYNTSLETNMDDDRIRLIDGANMVCRAVRAQALKAAATKWMRDARGDEDEFGGPTTNAVGGQAGGVARIKRMLADHCIDDSSCDGIKDVKHLKMGTLAMLATEIGLCVGATATSSAGLAKRIFQHANSQLPAAVAEHDKALQAMLKDVATADAEYRSVLQARSASVHGVNKGLQARELCDAFGRLHKFDEKRWPDEPDGMRGAQSRKVVEKIALRWHSIARYKVSQIARDASEGVDHEDEPRDGGDEPPPGLLEAVRLGNTLTQMPLSAIKGDAGSNKSISAMFELLNKYTPDGHDPVFHTKGDKKDIRRMFASPYRGEEGDLETTDPMFFRSKDVYGGTTAGDMLKGDQGKGGFAALDRDAKVMAEEGNLAEMNRQLLAVEKGMQADAQVRLKEIETEARKEQEATQRVQAAADKANTTPGWFVSSKGEWMMCESFEVGMSGEHVTCRRAGKTYTVRPDEFSVSKPLLTWDGEVKRALENPEKRSINPCMAPPPKRTIEDAPMIAKILKLKPTLANRRKLFPPLKPFPEEEPYIIYVAGDQG